MLRPAGDRRTFARLLRAGRYDYVVLQRHRLRTRPRVSRLQEGWLQGLGYRAVAGDDAVRLYARPGS
jgi:hypothetical protein